MYSYRLQSTSLNPTGLLWCSRCSFNWKWELGDLHSSHPAIIFSRDLGTHQTSYVTNEMTVASCCIRSQCSRQHPFKSGAVHLVKNNPFKSVWGLWSVASSVVNRSTIFTTKLLSNKLCQRGKKDNQNNAHMTHISQKLNFPLCPFTVVTIVTALPYFLFSACFCTPCMLHFLFLHCLFMLGLFSCVDRCRTWTGLQNAFFLLLLSCTWPKPADKPYVLQTRSKVLWV